MNELMLRETAPRGGMVKVAYLKRNDACLAKRKQFQKMWPEGMPLTRANVVKTLLALEEMGWVLQNLMNSFGRQEFGHRLDEERKKYYQKMDELRNKLSVGGLTQAQYDHREKVAHSAFSRRKAVVICEVLGIA